MVEEIRVQVVLPVKFGHVVSGVAFDVLGDTLAGAELLQFDMERYLE